MGLKNPQYPLFCQNFSIFSLALACTNTVLNLDLYICIFENICEVVKIVPNNATILLSENSKGSPNFQVMFQVGP